MSVPPAAGSTRTRRFAVAALVALLAAYAAQVATPLRLTVDSVDYLSIATSLAHGHGIPSDSGFPPGLPALYALLDSVGLGESWAIVAVNWLFVVVAVWSTLWLYRHVLGLAEVEGLGLCCVALLSYVLVKHAALALSEVPFLGLVSAALVLLERGARRDVRALAAGLALTAAAIAVRLAGAALVPAALVALVAAARGELPLGTWLVTRRRSVVATAAGSALIVATAVWVLAGSRYVSESGVGTTSRGAAVAEHFRSWGEVAANVPRTRLPDVLELALVPVGIAALALILWGLRRTGRPLGPTPVFFLSYLALVFAWPYDDARFWLPLVPLGLGYAFVALRPLLRLRVVAGLAVAYLVAFAAAGVGALVYDTRVSYAGTRFADRYGSDSGGEDLRPTYRVAFGVPRPGDAARVNARALAILRHYERRARGRRRRAVRPSRAPARRRARSRPPASRRRCGRGTAAAPRPGSGGGCGQ